MSPTLDFSEPTLNDRAVICKYKDRKYLYLRVKRDGKRYTQHSLNTTDMNTAHSIALDVYVKIQSSPPTSGKSTLTIQRVFENYMLEKNKKLNRGLIKPNTQKIYQQRIDLRFTPYLKFKNIKNMTEIRKDTFDGYAGFQLDRRTRGRWKTETKGLSHNTINKDISQLNEIFKWMVEKEFLLPRNQPKIERIKDLKKYTVESNPAYLPNDWKRFNDELYKFDQGWDDEYETWKRRWFINYIRFMYQGGFRPHESRKIRFGDCEIITKNDKSACLIQIDENTKTGRRECSINSNTFLKLKSHLDKGIKLRNRQIEDINRRLSAGDKTIIDTYRKKVKEPIQLLPPRDKDDLVLMNPFLKDRKIYHSEHIRDWYREIVTACKFDRKYTLYSLRSTHISNRLLQGIPVNKVAKNVGTSMEMIQKTYDGLSARYSIDELGTSVPEDF